MLRQTVEMLEERTLLSFSTPAITGYPTLTGFFESETTGDFNGDGKLDIATLTYTQLNSPKLLTILQGNGDGTFQAQTPITLKTFSDGGLNNLAAGRLNGDNFDDLVLLNGAFEVKVFFGAAGGLTASNNLTMPFTTSLGSPGDTIALGHFERPDRLDIAILPQDNGSVLRLMVNQGDGTFVEKQFALASDSPNGIFVGQGPAHQVFVEDLNGDGLDDAIFTIGYVGFGANSRTSIVTIKKTSSPENFSVSTVSTETTNSGKQFDLQAGLIDGDGLLDLAVTPIGNGGAVQLFKGQADGSFQAFAASPYTGGNPLYATSSVAFGKFVGGPATDLAISPQAGFPDPIHGEQKYVFGIAAGQGDGNFGAPMFVNRNSAGEQSSEAGQLLVADVNGDGSQDLINLYPTLFEGGRTSVLLNTGGTHTTLVFPDLSEGSPITIVATVDKNTVSAPGIPGGTVTFLEGTTVLGNATVTNGVATSALLFLSAGDHTITATYSGDDNFLSNVSPASPIHVIVNPGRTKTTLDFPNLVEGQALISANITKYFSDTQGTLDGTVTFMEGTQVLGQADVVGGQVVAPLDVAAGDHTVFAVYNGSSDGVFTKSTSANFPITILPPPMPDLGLLHITTDNGGLKFNRANEHFEYSGIVHIGLASDPSQTLLDLSGFISVGDSVIMGQGTVTAHVGAFSAVLFNGSFQFDIGLAVTHTIQAPALPDSLKIAGMGVNFNQIELVAGGLNLGGRLQLPDLFGGHFLDFAVGAGITIDANGVSSHFGGGKIGFPNVDFSLAGLGIKASDLSIDYDGPNDLLKIQGKVVLPDLFGGIISGATINLAGNNFIQVHSGQVGIVGDLTIKRLDIVPNVWYLKDVKLHLDTVSNSFEGSGTLFIPGGLGISVDLALLNGHLDKVVVGVDGLNLPVPLLPGAFLKSLSGGVEGLTTTHPTFTGTAGFTYLPAVAFDLPTILGGQHFSVSLVSLDLTATFDNTHVDATGSVDLLKGVTGSGQSVIGAPTTVDINWLLRTIHVTTDVHLIDNIVDVGADFTANAKGNVTIDGQASVNLPALDTGILGIHISPQTLGSANLDLQFTNDGNSTNDFVKLTGTANLPILGNLTIGVKLYFNGKVDFIGLKDPVGQTFDIPVGTAKYLLDATWTNNVGNVPVEVIDPNGRVYTEADFDNINIGVIPQLSGPTSKSIGLLNPIPGMWTLRIPNETGLGPVVLHGFHEVPAPTLSITSLTTGANGVTIGYDAGSTESTANVTLLYDTDNSGLNGPLIATGLPGTAAGQSFVWDTTGIAAGTYYVYGKIDDGINPSVFAYSPMTVVIANLPPVVAAIANQTVNEGETLTLTASGVDPNGDSVTYSLAAGTPDGVDIDPTTGELTWTPTEIQGPDSYPITVVATDTGTPALSGTQTFNITVNEVNSAPVIRKLFAESAPHGGTFNFTVGADDSDLPLQTLRFSLDPGAPVGATVDLGTGVFSWSPNATLTAGDYPVTFRVTDSGTPAMSSTATVNLTITSASIVVPGTLAFGAAAYSVDEGGNATITVNRTGGSDGVVTVQYAASSGSATAGLDFTPTSGILIFGNGVTSQSFTVPALSDALLEGPESVNLALSNVIGGATIGNQQQSSLTIIDVVAVNPNFTSPATFSIAENLTAVGTVAATDPNVPPNPVTFSITGGVDAAKFAITSAGVLTFKTAPDFEVPGDIGGDNVYNLQVTANNGAGGIMPQSIAVTVTPANDNAPLFTSLAAFNVAENLTAVGTVTATDADLPAQTLTFSITGGADSAKFAITSAGVLTFQVAPDFENPTDAGANNVYDLQITARDGNGRMTPQSVAVTVTPVNDNAPVFTSPLAYSVAEGITAVGTTTAADADRPVQTVTYTLTGGVDESKFSITSAGVLKFIAAPSFANPTDVGADNVYNLQVTANDGAGLTTIQNIAVTVAKVNAGPSISLAGTAASYHVNKKHVPIAIDGAATFNAGTPNPGLAGAKLVVSVSANHNSTDIVGVLAGSSSDVHLKGKHFVLGKTVIGSVAGGKAKTPNLTITFTGAATSELVQKILEKLSFSTKSVGTGPRTIQMHLSGSGGLNTNTATRQITVQ